MLAEVAEEHVAQAFVCELLHRLGTFVVRKVPAPAAYPVLQRLGVGAAAQHPVVVVRLYHHGVRLAGELHGLLRHPAGVGHDQEPVSVQHDGVAHGLRSVVRDGEIACADASRDYLVPSLPELMREPSYLTGGHEMVRQHFREPGSRQYGETHVLAVRSQRAYVVEMVVGDEYRGDASGVDSVAGELLLQPAGAHSGVHQHRAFAAPSLLSFFEYSQEIAVSAAP